MPQQPHQSLSWAARAPHGHTVCTQPAHTPTGFSCQNPHVQRGCLLCPALTLVCLCFDFSQRGFLPTQSLKLVETINYFFFLKSCQTTKATSPKTLTLGKNQRWKLFLQLPGCCFLEHNPAGCTCPAPLPLPLGSFPFSLSRTAGTGSHHTSNIAWQGWAIWFEKQNKINTTGSNLCSVA